MVAAKVSVIDDGDSAGASRTFSILTGAGFSRPLGASDPCAVAGSPAASGPGLSWVATDACAHATLASAHAPMNESAVCLERITGARLKKPREAGGRVHQAVAMPLGHRFQPMLESCARLHGDALLSCQLRDE
jgi:hypothetical protein